MIERIGNCRVVAEIGSGGMAVVYRAVQETLNRTVAIKVLKGPAMAEASLRVRFEREALSVAALQHENIIQIYDFHGGGGERGEGGPAFIVMEFVEGIDLFDLLEKAVRLPSEVGAIVALQVARGLDYAHYRGIVHRDVKPANIMVARNGGVKLTDFGIARDRSFDDLTKDGTGLGTPSYMSPEQVVGDPIDFRSDVFSLGIVLYQMVCGRKPFVEDEQRSVLRKIQTERPMLPRKLNPEVPRELERIILRCLEKKPQDRFRSTQDLVVALERFLAPRCEMNYRARLVMYLSEIGLVSKEEVEGHLHPAVSGGYGVAEGRKPALERLALSQLAIAAGMAAVVGLVHLSPLGAARPGPAGFVRVLAEPWADVYVDGKLQGTTPLPRPIALPEGAHQLELRNPYFSSVDRRRVEVQRGETISVRATFRR